MNLEQAVNKLVAKLRDAMPGVSVDADSAHPSRIDVKFNGHLRARCTSDWTGSNEKHLAQFNPLYSLGEWQGDCVIKSRRFTIGLMKMDPVCDKIVAHVTTWLAEHARVIAEFDRVKAELDDAIRRLKGATRVERFHTGLFDAHFIGPIDEVEAAILACADNIRARQTPTDVPQVADVE